MERSYSNLLISRQEQQFVGWVAIDEFENLFTRLTNSEILSPTARRPVPRVLDRVRSRALGDFVPVRERIPRGELLLVVARTPINLQMLEALGSARRQFRHIAGVVIDSFFTEGFGPATRHFDHIFSTTEEGAEAVRSRFGVTASVLRQGFDCLNWSSLRADRSIDVIGFGRQPPSYHRAFQGRFHDCRSPVLYLHSPIGTLSGPAVWQERPMLLKLLQRSKIALAFHLDVEPHRRRPRASGFITSRWFESLASGCVILGKRPKGTMADEMLCWPDATIELSNNPAEAAETVERIASDAAFLCQVRRRNVVEMCRRHDWRYRIRDIYQHFQMTLPGPLIEELDSLRRLTKSLEAGMSPDAVATE